MTRYLILKIVLITAVFNPYAGCYAQDPDTSRIRVTFATPAITGFERLSSNRAPHVKNFYAIYFNNGTTAIYNADSDSLYPTRYQDFRLANSNYIGYCERGWQIFREDGLGEKYGWYELTFGQEQEFDSIHSLDYDHYIGYSGAKGTLFWTGYEDPLRVENFVELKEPLLSTPVSYAGGFFVKTRSSDEFKPPVVAYRSMTGGQMLTDFLADSIIIYPDVFNEYSLVLWDKKAFVYSYAQNAVIESGFPDYYVVPVYDFPLIVQPGYVAFGGREWTKLKIKEVVMVEFEVDGDLVFALLTNASGKVYRIDLWERKVVR
jgi:hypothetical protein